MGNNMVPYAVILGGKYTYFIAHQYKYIENNKIEERILLKVTKMYPYDYHLNKCGVDSSKKLERSLIQTFWPGVGEDTEDEVEEDGDFIETSYNNGNKDVVKSFNQKCVFCLERDSEYAFRQCGHQCICEHCYQNKGDIDILKW